MNNSMIEMPATDGTGIFQDFLSLLKSGRESGLVPAQKNIEANRTLREVADDYAAAGYRVLVPDLFGRQERGVQ